MTRSVTVATMLTTDGTTAVYGVFHATLYRAHLPIDKQFIDLHRAEHVGSITHHRSAGRFDYFAGALRFATRAYPAFAWPMECPCCRQTVSWVEDHAPTCTLLAKEESYRADDEHNSRMTWANPKYR